MFSVFGKLSPEVSNVWESDTSASFISRYKPDESAYKSCRASDPITKINPKLISSSVRNNLSVLSCHHGTRQDPYLLPSFTHVTKDPILKVNRVRQYWQNKRILRNTISEVRFDNYLDNRPYADVTINGIEYRGLLDSGASITALGVGSERFLEDPKFKIFYMPTKVHMASGSSERMFGYMYVKIQYNGLEKVLRVHIVPNLKQKLYLGIDFWKAFNIKIVPPSICEIDNEAKKIIIDEYLRHDLSPNQTKLLNEVISKFPSFEERGLGHTHLVTHTIDIRDAKAIKQRHYAVSPAIQKLLYQELDRMLSLGVIEESNSSWSSPVTLIRKSNGKVRMCLDARKLNDVTVRDAYPLPIIDGLLSRLDQTKYISSIDLKDAFWQIPLAQESRDKTAFTVPGRPLYQFTVMPFGLCNAPQTMCRLMHRVIPHQLHQQVFVYLDDLLITSENFEEHIQLLGLVATLLRDAGLTVNLAKSKFLLKEIRYLGYVVGDGCLRVDSEKVNAILAFPVPNTVKKVRRFLGMSGWYRRFIPSYATLAAPLSDLLKKEQKFKWNDQSQNAFDRLKQALSTAPVLVHPNFDRPFYIQCDASSTGVGSVLFQVSDDGSEHPIAYMSQKLNAAQRNYSITELECFAAVLSIKKFRAYVEGCPFTIITDHASLKWLMGQNDLAGRLARWSLKLQSFDFKIEHRKGALNVVPDALSRAFMESIEQAVLNVDLNSSEFKSKEYVDLVEKIRKNQEEYVNLRLLNDKVYINPSNCNNESNTDVPLWKLYIPRTLVEQLITQAHDPPSSSHLGIAKTLNRLQRYYYWPGMPKDVKDYITSCGTCKKIKAPNSFTQPMMGNQIEVLRPMQRLYIDFLGPYPRSKMGNAYLLVVLDLYSKYIFLKPLKAALASAVCTFLEKDIFSIYSVPESITSDNATQFRSVCLESLLNKYGIKHIFTPKYAPQCNASERVNRSILAAIRAYIKDNHRAWDEHLHSIGSALRNAIHSATHFSPHFIMFGQHYISHRNDYKLLRKLNQVANGEISIQAKANRISLCQREILSHLEKTYKKGAHNYNLRSRPRELIIGQTVFVRNFALSDAVKNYSTKLAPKFIEAKVLRKVGNVAYELTRFDGKSIGIYHVKDIRT